MNIFTGANLYLLSIYALLEIVEHELNISSIMNIFTEANLYLLSIYVLLEIVEHGLNISGIMNIFTEARLSQNAHAKVR